MKKPNDAELRALHDDGLIPAIRLYRARCGTSLLDTKHHLEKYRDLKPLPDADELTIMTEDGWVVTIIDRAPDERDDRGIWIGADDSLEDGMRRVLSMRDAMVHCGDEASAHFAFGMTVYYAWPRDSGLSRSIAIQLERDTDYVGREVCLTRPQIRRLLHALDCTPEDGDQDIVALLCSAETVNE